jgi:hypothetical protein
MYQTIRLSVASAADPGSAPGRLLMVAPAPSRTQSLVLGFVLVVLASVIVIRALEPDVYDRALRLPSGDDRLGNLFLAALTAFLTLLAIGVLRRWRWLFWLVMVAFLAGLLRVPVVILQLTGILATDLPDWYLAYQGLLGLAQFPIGLAMVAGYRRAGVWE